jgi:hypothetical protein
MKTYFECLPCFVNQALGLLKRATATDAQKKVVMQEVFRVLAAMDYHAPPPIFGKTINRIVSNAVNRDDLYSDDKKRFNTFALHMLPEMRKRAGACSDVFMAKVKLAIAANIIDFGKNDTLTECHVLTNFEKALETTIDEGAVSLLRDAMERAGKILFLCDNTGEIIFDRLLIEDMPYHKITCAVRGAPVINDATLDDAETSGLTGLVKVISNGSGVPGTILEECSHEFNNLFEEADVIIAKGQGNFETLSDITDKTIFFLLQVKCPIIARDIGFPVGTFVIKNTSPKNHLVVNA